MIVRPQPGFKPYNQEGKIGGYQCMMWILAVAHFEKALIPVSWGEMFAYFKKKLWRGAVG